MLKLTRTYNDYNGVSRTEDFYFNPVSYTHLTLPTKLEV